MHDRPVTAVAFDFGETLVDETRYWSEWATLVGVSPLTLFARLGAAIERGEHHTTVLEGADASGDAPEFSEADLYPDARDTLESLRAAGLRVAVAGNFGREVAEEVRRWGLAADVVISAEELGAEKPDARFFIALARVLEVRPEDLLYVGDRIDNDVIAAREAGCRSLLLRRGPWAAIQEPKLRPGGPDVDDLAAVVTFVAGPPG